MTAQIQARRRWPRSADLTVPPRGRTGPGPCRRDAQEHPRAQVETAAEGEDQAVADGVHARLRRWSVAVPARRAGRSGRSGSTRAGSCRRPGGPTTLNSRLVIAPMLPAGSRTWRSRRCNSPRAASRPPPPRGRSLPRARWASARSRPLGLANAWSASPSGYRSDLRGRESSGPHDGPWRDCGYGIASSARRT